MEVCSSPQYSTRAQIALQPSLKGGLFDLYGYEALGLKNWPVRKTNHTGSPRWSHWIVVLTTVYLVVLGVLSVVEGSRLSPLNQIVRGCLDHSRQFLTMAGPVNSGWPHEFLRKLVPQWLSLSVLLSKLVRHGFMAFSKLFSKL